MAQEFTAAGFDNDVLKAAEPVLVDFWAPWCGPCKTQGPIIDELATQMEGKGVKIGKLNVDEQPAPAQQYGVMSIPTLILFKNGAPLKQWVGVQQKETLAQALEEAKA